MKIKFSLSLPILPILILILFPLIAYFEYGKSIDFAVAMLILLVCYSLTLVTALIPCAGVIIQGFIMYYFVRPFVYSLTGLYPTWLTSIAFILILSIGTFLTCITTLCVFLYWRG